MILNKVEWTPEMQKEILDIHYPFWTEMDRGKLLEALGRELYDLREVRKTICTLAEHFTFGMLSKPNYSAETIIQVHEENLRDMRYEADSAAENGMWMILWFDEPTGVWKDDWDTTVYTDLVEAIDNYTDAQGRGHPVELFELKRAGDVEDDEE